MTMTPERAQQIVADMTGTCMSVDHFLEDGEDANDPVLAEAIDSEIFCCSCCEWWCELNEAALDKDGDSKDCCTDCDEEEVDC